jgi:hypothetical protein
MNTIDRYAKIREALEMGPTPGPWGGIQNDGSRWTDIYQISNRYATPIVYVPPYRVLEEHGILNVWKERKDKTIANVKHVAACDPDTIRELLAERDALAAENERLRAERDALTEAALAEKDKEIAALREALRGMSCPRPCNHRPDDFEVGECFDAGECGCIAGTGLAYNAGGNNAE